jgi:hypothetical protein
MVVMALNNIVTKKSNETSEVIILSKSKLDAKTKSMLSGSLDVYLKVKGVDVKITPTTENDE